MPLKFNSYVYCKSYTRKLVTSWQTLIAIASVSEWVSTRQEAEPIVAVFICVMLHNYVCSCRQKYIAIFNGGLPKNEF